MIYALRRVKKAGRPGRAPCLGLDYGCNDCPMGFISIGQVCPPIKRIHHAIERVALITNFSFRKQALKESFPGEEKDNWYCPDGQQASKGEWDLELLAGTPDNLAEQVASTPLRCGLEIQEVPRIG